MKRRLLALGLAGALALSGCSSLLDREYVHVSPHNTAPTAEGDPNTLRAESYQELVNILMYFVTMGTETGKLRLYLDSEAVEADLEAACLEVVQEDPLGAYAVEFIKYSVNSLVTYFEAEVQITYRRSREQVASIVSATGVTAIRSELESALASCATERVLRISYFDGDEEFIRDLARQAYCAHPSAALDMPELTVSIYPETGRQRIVEIQLAYHLEPAERERRAGLLSQSLYRMAQALEPELDTWGNDQAAPVVARAVLGAGGYDPEGGATPYHALLAGGADSEGLALAFSALCGELGVPCHLVEGTREDAPWFWNIVSTPQGWRHLDLTQWESLEAEGSEPLRTDPELKEAGFVWDTAAVPSCPAPRTEQPLQENESLREGEQE